MAERRPHPLRTVATGALPLAVVLAITALAVVGVSRFVDLRPYVEPNFFFSSDDPAFQEDREISDLFPHPAQIILSVKGETDSKPYERGIKALTQAIAELPEVVGVQSMTRGPGNFRNAVRSPLWRRLLIAEEGRATNLFVFLEDLPPAQVVRKLEAIREEFQQPDFEIVMSGVPYVLELIRRSLGRDFQVFSVMAFVVLGLVTLLIFRSVPLVAGVLISCANASMLTLIATHLLGMRVEVLTANLAAIVFVLCLSHLVFMTFNLRHVMRRGGRSTPRRVGAAVQLTLGPSFWSMLTTLLGFASLLFVQAAPLRNFGRAGMVGTIVAFVVAYGLYPSFLRAYGRAGRGAQGVRALGAAARANLRRWQHVVVGVVILGCVLVASGARRLHADPSLLSYFAKESEIYRGLEYIDRNLGSSPLKLVVSDPKGKDFDSGRTYQWLWRLQDDLEKDEEVGSVLSLPLILAEARRFPLVALLPVEWVIEAMESKEFDRTARYFLTEDRFQALFWLIMREEARRGSRVETVERIRALAQAQGFNVDLVGGVYLLQGKLATLVIASLRRGVTMLILLFVGITWLLSRSLRVGCAMLVSVCLIPFWLLGLIGYSQAPFDIISAPAVNLAIAMGVDAMLHLLNVVRRVRRRAVTDWDSWMMARERLWWPVIYSAVIVCVGFAIFGASVFPPTQRFGLSIVVGTVMSPLAALFVLPVLAGSRSRAHMVPGLARRRLTGRRR